MPRRMKALAVMVVVIGVGLPLFGCPGALPPEVSGALKIANNQWSQLTGAEIYALVQAANAADPDLNLNITREQADIIAQFLRDNEIDSPADWNAVVEQAANDPGSIVIPDGAEELFSSL